MFNWKFLKKVKIKGVSMVEYAVLLAFVAVVAGVFMDDGGLKGGIQGSVDKVLVRLGVLEDKDDNIAKWSELQYKTVGNDLHEFYSSGVDKSAFFQVIKDHGNVILSNDKEAVAALVANGMPLPTEGEGNWAISTYKVGGVDHFNFTWTLENGTPSSGQVKTMSYLTNGTYGSRLGYGYADVDTNGNISSYGTVLAHYSIQPDKGWNYNNCYTQAINDYNNYVVPKS